MNYERIIQWLSGPVSILAGFAATQLVGVPHGAQHDGLASGITQIGEFGVGAGVTYLAHHKFLTNVAHWWAHQAAVQGGSIEPAAIETTVASLSDAVEFTSVPPTAAPVQPESAVTPDTPTPLTPPPLA